jgi:hypothetical protein
MVTAESSKEDCWHSADGREAIKITRERRRDEEIEKSKMRRAHKIARSAQVAERSAPETHICKTAKTITWRSSSGEQMTPDKVARRQGKDRRREASATEALTIKVGSTAMEDVDSC